MYREGRARHSNDNAKFQHEQQYHMITIVRPTIDRDSPLGKDFIRDDFEAYRESIMNDYPHEEYENFYD